MEQPPYLIPTLTTERLLLRPVRYSDCDLIESVVSLREVAAMMTSVPHPYPHGGAELWLSTHAEMAASGGGLTCAITVRGSDTVVGVISLRTNIADETAELGYWINPPNQGQGYCTEAARAMRDHAFDAIGVRRVHARALGGNAASTKVMEKVGMQREGVQRGHILRLGQVHDQVLYGMTADDPRG